MNIGSRCRLAGDEKSDDAPEGTKARKQPRFEGGLLEEARLPAEHHLTLRLAVPGRTASSWFLIFMMASSSLGRLEEALTDLRRSN
jgi:hypothetical protein